MYKLYNMFDMLFDLGGLTAYSYQEIMQDLQSIDLEYFW